jgi:FkbM family methyltransferase
MSIRKIAKTLKLKRITERFNFTSSVTLNSKKFIIPIIKNMGFSNLKLKSDWFLQLLKQLNLPKDSSFIDIGVNVGQTLLTFKSCYNNPYWGFEPNSACVFYLNTLIDINNIKNANIIPLGLSSHNSVAKFYLKGDVDSAATTVNELRPDFYEVQNATYVPLFSFDSLELAEINNISLIKIDVEGAELEVLLGLTETIRKYQPRIICEILDYHADSSKQVMQERADKLFTHVSSLNYDIYRLVHTGNEIQTEKQDKIVLKQWTEESFDLNDYLLVPKGKTPF